jgi:voltage-gated potassium channel Kch
VAGASNVSSATLICAVNSYLLIGLSLAMLFILLNLLAPNSFNLAGNEDRFSTFVYYSFVTLTTLGYGDILPLTPVARSLATFTALFGQLYLVIIMAFLIGKYLNAKNQST